MLVEQIMVLGVMLALSTLSACSAPPEPIKVADVAGSPHQVALFMYRPGCILDDYLSVGVGAAGLTRSLVSI